MLVAELLKRVREIRIRAGRQVDDLFSGQYVSVFKGRGMEFDEVRPYTPGDEIRDIDWNVTARMGAPFVKRYVEERQRTLLLLADTSASVDFGSTTRSKGETIAEICALLSLAAIREDDKVGLVLFADSVRRFLPPRKGSAHAMRVIREVVAAGPQNDISMSPVPGRSTDLAAALGFLRTAVCRRSICFVISDLQDNPAHYLEPLRGARRNHDVIAVWVVDRRERRLPPAGLIRLYDAERGTTRLVDTSSRRVREAYAQESERRTESLRRDLRSARIDLIEIDVEGSTVDPLVRFFRMRERRARHR